MWGITRLLGVRVRGMMLYCVLDEDVRCDGIDLN